MKTTNTKAAASTVQKYVEVAKALIDGHSDIDPAEMFEELLLCYINTLPARELTTSQIVEAVMGEMTKVIRYWYDKETPNMERDEFASVIKRRLATAINNLKENL